MKFTWYKTPVPAAALSMMLSGAPISMAATGPAQGDTSGPASGTQTTPSTAVQKQMTGSKSGTAGGAPGMEGKQGAESGAKPKTSAAGQPATKQ